MPDRTITLLPTTTLAADLTDNVFNVYPFDPKEVSKLTVIAELVRAGGGSTCKVWIETSFDGGSTWVGIMNFAFTTSSDRKLCSIRKTVAVAAAYDPDTTLGDDAIKDGLLGGKLRAKLTTTGTYTGASSIVAKGELS